MLLDFTLCSNKSQNMDKVMHFVCFLNDCCNYIRKQASCTVWILFFHLDTAGIFRDYQKALCLVLRLSGHSFPSAVITACHGGCQHLVSTSVQQWQLCSRGLKTLKNLIWAQFSKERENRGKRSSESLFLHSKEKQSPGMATASLVPGAGKQLLQGVTWSNFCSPLWSWHCPAPRRTCSASVRIVLTKDKEVSYMNALSSGMVDSLLPVK